MEECVRCGKCVTVCPLYTLSHRETASPRGMLALIDLLDRGRIRPDTEIRTILRNCMLCGRCNNCPVGIDPLERIGAALVKYGGTPHRRPLIASRPRLSAKAETLIFPGCTLQSDPPLLGTILKGVSSFFSDFTVAYDHCCGARFLSEGDEKRALFAIARLSSFARKSGAKRLVTLCPLCATTLKKSSARYSLELPEVLFINETMKRRSRFPKTLKRVFYFGGCVSEASGWTLHASMKRAEIEVVGPDGIHCCGGGEGCAPTVLRDGLLDRILSEWRSLGALPFLTDCPRCLMRLKNSGVDASLSFVFFLKGSFRNLV